MTVAAALLLWLSTTATCYCQLVSCLHVGASWIPAQAWRLVVQSLSRAGVGVLTYDLVVARCE